MATRDRASLDDAPHEVPAHRHRKAGIRPWFLEHWPFVVALALGVVVRAVVQLAYSPGLVFSDGVGYLEFLNTYVPYTDRPATYDLLLLGPLSFLTDNVILVGTFAQHALGLATAAVMYLMLRRWGVRRWPATLAVVPVLLDTLQLVLEQSMLSDTLFVFLLVVGFAVLGWRRRPSPAFALAAGLVFGTAMTVRLVGEPLILTTAAFCLLVGKGWRGRTIPAMALLVGAAVPVSSYAVWYHESYGVYALSQFTNKALWLRTTTFVDCSRISVPRYERVLCPTQPLGHRLDPTFYGWHDPGIRYNLIPPVGKTTADAMGDFAWTAIRTQPLDYLRIGLRDFMLNFGMPRVDRYEYDTAPKWKFSTYAEGHFSKPAVRLYREFGGPVRVRQPYADILSSYEHVGYLPGPLLLACLWLGLLGGLGVGRARRPPMRSMCLLLTVSGTALLLVPDFTAEFIWRYQQPALLLLPASAALAYTAFRGQQDGGTAAAVTNE